MIFDLLPVSISVNFSLLHSCFFHCSLYVLYLKDLTFFLWKNSETTVCLAASCRPSSRTAGHLPTAATHYISTPHSPIPNSHPPTHWENLPLTPRSPLKTRSTTVVCHPRTRPTWTSPTRTPSTGAPRRWQLSPRIIKPTCLLSRLVTTGDPVNQGGLSTLFPQFRVISTSLFLPGTVNCYFQIMFFRKMTKNGGCVGCFIVNLSWGIIQDSQGCPSFNKWPWEKKTT